MPKALGVARNLGVAYYKKGDYKEPRTYLRKSYTYNLIINRLSVIEQINKVVSKL